MSSVYSVVTVKFRNRKLLKLFLKRDIPLITFKTNPVLPDQYPHNPAAYAYLITFTALKAKKGRNFSPGKPSGPNPTPFAATHSFFFLVPPLHTFFAKTFFFLLLLFDDELLQHQKKDHRNYTFTSKWYVCFFFSGKTQHFFLSIHLFFWAQISRVLEV